MLFLILRYYTMYDKLPFMKEIEEALARAKSGELIYINKKGISIETIQKAQEIYVKIRIKKDIIELMEQYISQIFTDTTDFSVSIFANILLNMIKYIESTGLELGYEIYQKSARGIIVLKYTPPTTEQTITEKATKQNQIASYIINSIQSKTPTPEIEISQDFAIIDLKALMQKYNCSDTTILRALKIVAYQLKKEYTRAKDKIYLRL